MLVRIFTFLLFCLFAAPMLPQNTEELLDQIDLKLRKDKKYLNIHYITFPNNRIDATLKNLPRTNFREKFSFEAKDNIMYNVIFLKDAVGIDSLVVLAVDQITDRAIGGERLFGETTGPVIDTERVLIYKDLYSLSRDGHPGYGTLFTEVRRYIKENPENPPSSLLRINPDTEIKTSLGIASRDNTDFLNFMRANHIHWYPKPKVVAKTTGRRGGAVTATDETPEYRIDAGFTGVTFSHKYMDFNIGSASVELGVDERTLNLLPYQQMSVVGGFRTFLALADKKESFDNAFLLDARLLVRVGVNMVNLPTSLPFMGGTKPKLLLGNAGGIDVSLSRAFGMPFLNLYLMAGTEPDMKDSPLKKRAADGRITAYYNTTSAEGTMSFYWNASVSMVTRFRLDVGAGMYDVYEAVFASATAAKPSQKIQKQNNLYPVVAFNFNFTPDGVDIYHAQLRFYDSQFKLSGWLKLFELEGGHVFRFDGTYIAPPMARKKRLWETDGGAIIQIRYRYGF